MKKKMILNIKIKANISLNKMLIFQVKSC